MNEVRIHSLLQYASLLNELAKNGVHVYKEIDEVISELRNELLIVKK